jgi:hypothetical protein
MLQVWLLQVIFSEPEIDADSGVGALTLVAGTLLGCPGTQTDWQEVIVAQEVTMTRIVGCAMLLIGAAAFATAGTPQVPEIDPSSGLGVLALLSGGLLVIRGRRKK